MQRQDRAGMIPTLHSQQDGEDRTYKPTIKTVSLVSQIQGEFSALACPLPAPETRTQFKFSQHVSRNLGGVLPRKKALGPKDWALG